MNVCECFKFGESECEGTVSRYTYGSLSGRRLCLRHARDAFERAELVDGRAGSPEYLNALAWVTGALASAVGLWVLVGHLTRPGVL